jgi:hypothetical protein
MRVRRRWHLRVLVLYSTQSCSSFDNMAKLAPGRNPYWNSTWNSTRKHRHASRPRAGGAVVCQGCGRLGAEASLHQITTASMTLLFSVLGRVPTLGPLPLSIGRPSCNQLGHENFSHGFGAAERHATAVTAANSVQSNYRCGTQLLECSAGHSRAAWDSVPPLLPLWYYV